MSGFEIPKIGDSNNGNVSLNPTLLSGKPAALNISFKFKDIPQITATESDVKAWLEKNFPEIKWDELSSEERRNYVIDYTAGTLEQKLKEQKKGNPTPANSTPEDIARRERHLQAETQLTKQAINFAIEHGIIEDTPEAISQTTSDRVAIADIKYKFARHTIENDDTILTNPQRGNRNLVRYFQVGNLVEEVAKANNLTIEELRNSNQANQLTYEFLKQKAENGTELNRLEANTLEKLREFYTENDGDLTGVKTLHEGADIEKSCMAEVFKDDENVDFENLTEDQRELLEQHITEEIKTCKTPEEVKERIKHILKHATSNYEQNVYYDIFVGMQNAELIDGNVLSTAGDEIGLSPHILMHHSVDMNTEGQINCTQHVAEACTGENPTVTATQAVAFLRNTVPKYTEEAKAPATNTITDTGLQEVYDVLPEVYNKLGETAAKEAYQYAMESENISAEQKAIIARDTIDLAGDNADLKKFYEEIANNYNVDYSSVPPKSERAATENSNTSNNENVANTDFTASEINDILAYATKPPSILESTLMGIQEVGQIILGKTPDPKSQFNQITTLDTALNKLKEGTSFAKVFNNCSEDVKKIFIKEILQSPQKGPAIKQLLVQGVPFASLLTYAPTENARKTIYNIATNVHISTVKAEVQQFATKV